jgi:hypothetical protein
MCQVARLPSVRRPVSDSLGFVEPEKKDWARRKSLPPAVCRDSFVMMQSQNPAANSKIVKLIRIRFWFRLEAT